MDIPNLASETPVASTPKFITVPIVAIVVCLALVGGFWISRVVPLQNNSSSTADNQLAAKDISNIVSADSITGKEVKVGQTYGAIGKTFTDTATGSLEAGSINGVGTHILVREGGLTQRASLTSSTLDLDLFVGHKVEVKGETNNSSKTGWLMDVGIVKVLE